MQLRPVEEANIIDFKGTVVGRFSTARITKSQVEFWTKIYGKVTRVDPMGSVVALGGQAGSLNQPHLAFRTSTSFADNSVLEVFYG